MWASVVSEEWDEQREQWQVKWKPDWRWFWRVEVGSRGEVYAIVISEPAAMGRVAWT
jgi:hypothetical protein